MDELHVRFDNEQKDDLSFLIATTGQKGCVIYLFILKIILFIYRERGREGEREAEKTSM